MSIEFQLLNGNHLVLTNMTFQSKLVKELLGKFHLTKSCVYKAKLKGKPDATLFALKQLKMSKEEEGFPITAL